MNRAALLAVVIAFAAAPAYAQTSSPSPGQPAAPAGTDPVVVIIGVITILLALGAGLFIYRVIRKGL